jgi:trehalose/maltose hydrolase-like predicted phosphorylase
MGGTWQALAYGFCGLRPRADALAVDPHIPEHWKALELTVRFRGTRVRVRAELARTLVWADEPVQIAFGASGRLVEAGPAGIELKVDGSVSADASAPAAASAASA